MTVRLEPFAERHLDDVRGLLSDPDVLRFTRVPEPAPPVGRVPAHDRRHRRPAAVRVHCPPVAGDGLAARRRALRAAHWLRLCDIVALAARGRGVGTEILRLLTRWGFEEACALRIYLIIQVDIGASRKMAERCGYALEGVMRSAHVKQGIRADQELWSRLASDPEPA